MDKSKVKAHIRRTKSGQVRVKEGQRSKTSLGKKAAIAGGVGLGLVGLRLVTKQKPKSVFKMDGPLNKSTGEWSSKRNADNLLNNSRQVKIDAIRNSIVKARFDLFDIRKAAVIDKMKPSNLKNINNNAKLLKRRRLLNKVDAVVGGDMKPIYAASGKVNKNKVSRKEAGKRLAEAAKDLRSRGIYE